MFCSKCGNEIKETEQFCSKCGAPVGGKGKNTKSTKVIIIAIICILAVIAVAFFMTRNNKGGTGQGNEKGFIQTSANVQANGVQKLSFNNMSGDTEGLEQVQKDLINYFDNDYFEYYGKSAQKYPQVFKGAKVVTDGVVVKVLKSTDEDFEVVIAQGSSYSYNNIDLEEIEKTTPEALFILKGKQQNARLTKEDEVTICGRYNDVNTTEIDGKSYTLPTIEMISCNSHIIGQDNYKFSFETIKNVAEYIFGKDIKVNEPVSGQDYTDGFGGFFKVTFDNQSNANFKVFNMNKYYGEIEYNKIHNGLSNNIVKKLFVGADFNHYIVSTYDEDLKHVYIDYFDRDLKKVWSREFDYNSTKAFASPMDYTAEQMAIVVDNDLYLLDLKTGENIIEPVLVGEKIRVNMMDDGIILIGDNNKDTIMKVDYKGKILFKQNAETGMDYIESASTQVINGKLVLKLLGPADSIKYLVINSEGTIEVATDDLF